MKTPIEFILDKKRNGNHDYLDSYERSRRTFHKRIRGVPSGKYLPEIERCLEQPTGEDVWRRAGDESNGSGNLILHLEGNVRALDYHIAGQKQRHINIIKEKYL